jgi:hypothetical protein
LQTEKLKEISRGLNCQYSLAELELTPGAVMNFAALPPVLPPNGYKKRAKNLFSVSPVAKNSPAFLLSKIDVDNNVIIVKEN